MYQPDSFAASLIWGRIGAGVLALVAFVLSIFGYVMTPEDVENANLLIIGLISGVGGVLALVSKIREKKKVE